MGTLNEDAFDFSGPSGLAVKRFLDTVKTAEYKFDPLTETSKSKEEDNDVSKSEKKTKMKGSRLKADYEFLLDLSKTLDASKEEEETAVASQISHFVEEGISFIEGRAEFWTNVK